MTTFDYPETMEELLYFTNRKLDDGTKLIAYVKKKTCDACNKALMGKPINEKTGRPKTRAATYNCPSCNHEEEKKEHEASLQMEIQYTNPEDTEVKTAHTEYKRKTWQGIPAFVFMNEFTGEKLGITKRLKKKKEKK